MKYKDFKKFRQNNNLQLLFHLSKKMKVITDKNKEDIITNRFFADEVTHYRTKRYNCGKTCSQISKIKVNL